ncbi:MAG: PKD domain-containing protein [Phycisphaerae bacterium]
MTGDRSDCLRPRLVCTACLPALLLGLVSSRTSLADCTLTSTGKTPLNDLGGGTYLGQAGGLYPNGGNVRPAAHSSAGLDIANNQIIPLNAAGQPDPISGVIVLVSIGLSNTTQEFATRGPGAFKPRADADPAKNPQLVIVDCAQGGVAAVQWANPANQAWTVADQRLAGAGVSPAQVQAAWVKLAERSSDPPDSTFPAHAQWHQANLEQVLRNLHVEYPNLKLAFMTSRTRSYEDNPQALNPEPFAYEENFSVKWVVEDQINGAGNINFDPMTGPVLAPFVVWGPYIWTDGLVPRSDGFIWRCQDLAADFTHPSPDGVTKVADQLVAFFKTDPLATPWFLRPSVIGQPPTVSIGADVTAGPPPLVVQFSAQAGDPDGQITETAWTFGDGGFSLQPNPAKTFPIAGDYPVYLTVTDNDGNAVTTSMTINIAPGAPVPTLSGWGLAGLALVLVVAAARVIGRRTVSIP